MHWAHEVRGKQSELVEENGPRANGRDSCMVCKPPFALGVFVVAQGAQFARTSALAIVQAGAGRACAGTVALERIVAGHTLNVRTTGGESGKGAAMAR
jgi:hypothetical protein